MSQTCYGPQGGEWPCGRAAKARLAELVSRGGIADLGAALVADGLAVAYTRYSNDYRAAEADARAARRGLWRGHFEHPEHRHHRHPRS